MKKLFREMMVLFLGGAFALSMNSCESEENQEKENEREWGYKSKNLVTGYLLPEEIEIKPYYHDSSLVSILVEANGFMASRVLVDKEIHDTIPFNEKRLKESDYNRSVSLFDSLSVLYGDTAYNQMVPMGEYWALAYPVDSIIVVSNVDYDQNHPAGEKLSDIVTVESYSYGKYVLCGYQNPQNFELKKKVCDMTQLDRTLMGVRGQWIDNPHIGGFYIPQTPNPRDCQLTVTYFFSNGLKLSASAQVEL